MPVNERYSALKSHIQEPPRKAWVITPDDDNDVAQVARWLRATDTGTVRLTLCDMPTGSYVDFTLAAGEQFWCAAIRVWATGTSVANLIAIE